MSALLPSQHRLSRLIAWLRLWLVWCGGFLVCLIESKPEHAEAITKAAAKCAADLLVIKAATIVRPRFSRHYGPQRTPASQVRIVKGARLRRRLRARDPLSRFFAILALMRDFDVELANLCKRMKNGLTRWIAQRYDFSSSLFSPLAPRLAVRADSS